MDTVAPKCRNCLAPLSTDCRCVGCTGFTPAQRRSVGLCHACGGMMAAILARPYWRAAQQEWVQEQMRRQRMLGGDGRR